MGRTKAIAGIWLGGFLLGFASYLTYPILKDTLTRIAIMLLQTESRMIGAVAAGMVSSILTMMLMLLLSYASKPKNY
ncbi:MAG: hypothetical protein HYU39_01050 [Thaumarchaeota archaeon]|nr:hypothetical protein [Nitrososphaerota archaeon]